MRTATAVLVGLAGLCNIAFAQEAACTDGVQAAYIPLVGNEDAAEYCFDKVLDRSDDSPSTTTTTESESTITATATLGSLRYMRRDKGRGKGEDGSSGRHGGGDEDRSLKSLLKSLSQGPFSVASTFCSCNFPTPPLTASVTASPTGPGCGGFPNTTDIANSTITSTVSLNATTTIDDSTITGIVTLTLTGDDGTVVTTTIEGDDDSTSTGVEDSTPTTSVDDSATTSV